MNKWLKIGSLIAFLTLTGLLLEALLWLWPKPFFLYLFFAFYLLLFIFIIFIARLKPFKKIFFSSILPIILSAATILFFTINKSWGADQRFFIINQLVLLISWLLLFFWLRSRINQDNQTSRLTMISVFYSLFLTNLSFFNLLSSYAVSMYFSVGMMLSANILVLIYLLYSQKLKRDFILLLIILAAILLLEAFLIVSFVPIGNYSKSGFLVLVFYMFWGLLEKIIYGKISSQQVAEYLGVSIFLFLIIISSSSWSFLNIR